MQYVTGDKSKTGSDAGSLMVPFSDPIMIVGNQGKYHLEAVQLATLQGNKINAYFRSYSMRPPVRWFGESWLGAYVYWR